MFLPVILSDGGDADKTRETRHRTLIQTLARVDSIAWLKAGQIEPEAAMALIGKLRILIPLSGLINKGDEVARLNREIGKLDDEMSRLSAKLNNEKFVARAPRAVVDKQRTRLAEVSSAHQQLCEQLDKIQAM